MSGTEYHRIARHEVLKYNLLTFKNFSFLQTFCATYLACEKLIMLFHVILSIYSQLIECSHDTLLIYKAVKRKQEVRVLYGTMAYNRIIHKQCGYHKEKKVTKTVCCAVDEHTATMN